MIDMYDDSARASIDTNDPYLAGVVASQALARASYGSAYPGYDASAPSGRYGELWTVTCPAGTSGRVRLTTLS